MSVATQRTKRRQQREETRRQILDAGREFLRERSFRELSVDALMSKTGHTRTVFYRHFDDVPSLVLAVIDEDGAELVAMAQEWAQVGRIGPDQARERLAAFVDYHARNGRLIYAISEAAHHDEAVDEAYGAMVEGFIAITAQAIQERVDNDELGPLDAPQVARALIHMLNGYLGDAFGREIDDVDADRALEVVWTIWTRTLFPASR